MVLKMSFDEDEDFGSPTRHLKAISNRQGLHRDAQTEVLVPSDPNCGFSMGYNYG